MFCWESREKRVCGKKSRFFHQNCFISCKNPIIMYPIKINKINMYSRSSCGRFILALFSALICNSPRCMLQMSEIQFQIKHIQTFQAKWKSVLWHLCHTINCRPFDMCIQRITSSITTDSMLCGSLILFICERSSLWLQLLYADQVTCAVAVSLRAAILGHLSHDQKKK